MFSCFGQESPVFQFFTIPDYYFAMTKQSFGFPKLGVLVLATLLVAGCSAQESAPTTSALQDDFQAEIETAVTLTIGSQVFSLEELEKRGATEIEILEPFKKESTKFTVIDFDQLLIDSGFTAEDRVETIALNDYRYTDTVRAFLDNDSLLAIYENGEPIPISDGGPVRIIFAESSAYYSVLDAWNWSLSKIELAGD